MSALEPRHVTVNGRTATMYGHPDDLYFHAVCVQEGYDGHLSDIASHALGDGAVMLDVGGNIGYFSMSTAIKTSLAGRDGVRMYAFEPAKINYEAFEMMLAANPELASNVHLMKYGLSAANTQATINYSDVNTAGAHLAAGLDDVYVNSETVELRTLASFVAESGIDRIDFMKIDIEGHELTLLESIEALVREYRPAILVEVNSWVIDLVARSATSVFVDFLAGLAPHVVGVHSDRTYIDIHQHRTAFLRANLLAKTHQDVLLDFDRDRLHASLAGFTQV